MSGLISIQIVRHPDGIPGRIFQNRKKVEKNQHINDKKAWKITQEAKS